MNYLIRIMKGYIYKIVEKGYDGTNGDDVYIGSTTSSLKDRLLSHIRSYRRWKKNSKCNYTASFSIFEKVGTENVEILKVKSLECNSVADLFPVEGEIQEEYRQKGTLKNIVSNSKSFVINNNFHHGETTVPKNQNIFKKFFYN